MRTNKLKKKLIYLALISLIVLGGLGIGRALSNNSTSNKKAHQVSKQEQKILNNPKRIKAIKKMNQISFDVVKKRIDSELAKKHITSKEYDLILAKLKESKAISDEMVNAPQYLKKQEFSKQESSIVAFVESNKLPRMYIDLLSLR